MSNIKKVIKNGVKFINKHYYLKPIFTILASIWLPFIVKYCGKDFGLMNQQENMYWYTVILTVIIYFGTSVIAFLSVAESQINKEYDAEIIKLESNNKLYEYLIESTHNICDNKYENIITYIDSCDKDFQDIYSNVAQPIRQLKIISKEMKSCFEAILPKKNKDLIISMAYNFPEVNGDWKWVDYKDLHGGFSIKELIDNESSAFYKIYSESETSVFFLDKEAAFKQNSYVFDKKDNSKKNNKVGSIACIGVPVIIQNKKIGRVIVSITSYGFKFDTNDDNEDNIRQTIEDVILTCFEKRIRIELALLYIQECTKANSISDKETAVGIEQELRVANNQSLS